MSSACYPNVLQSQIDLYCELVHRPRLMLSPGNELPIMKSIMGDPHGSDPDVKSLRRVLIARLAYYVKRCG